MKTYLTYGFYMALGGVILTFALYFTDFHSEPSKLATAQVIQSVVGLALSFTFVVLGTQARRAEIPLTEDFGYGRALGTGVMISLFAAVIGTISHYVYSAFINPNFIEVMVQAQTLKFEEKGMTSEQIERAVGMMRGIMRPGIQAAFGFIAGVFFGTVVSLITAAFLKRPATDELVST